MLRIRDRPAAAGTRSAKCCWRPTGRVQAARRTCCDGSPRATPTHCPTALRVVRHAYSRAPACHTHTHIRVEGLGLKAGGLGRTRRSLLHKPHRAHRSHRSH
eukprot:358535-Chlamydomonas_euryale.AAC.1